MRKVEEVSEAIRKSEGPLADIEAKFDQFMLTLPNLPNLAVKVGSNEGENREVRRLGESPKFDFTSKNHWDIGEELGILDFAGAAKIAGARAHQLHAGLTHWRGRLTEMLPPALVNRGSLVGTGQLPKSTRIYFISLPAIIFSSDELESMVCRAGELSTKRWQCDYSRSAANINGWVGADFLVLSTRPSSAPAITQKIFDGSNRPSMFHALQLQKIRDRTRRVRNQFCRNGTR